MPTHSFLAQDSHPPKMGEGAKCHSNNDQTSADRAVANGSRKVDMKDLKVSEKENTPYRSLLQSSTGPRRPQPSTSRGVVYHPIPQPWSEVRSAASGAFKNPVTDSPMRRWEQGSAHEEPWNNISGFYAGDLERAHAEHRKSDALILKDESDVRVEPAKSNSTSPELEDHRKSVHEAGDPAGLIGVGAWLR